MGELKKKKVFQKALFSVTSTCARRFKVQLFTGGSPPPSSSSGRGFLHLHLRRSVEQLEHVVDHLPQAVVQREVVVHQVDQEVVVVDVLDDHPRGRLVLVEFGPLLDPQGEGLVLDGSSGRRKV